MARVLSARYTAVVERATVAPVPAVAGVNYITLGGNHLTLGGNRLTLETL